MIAVSLVVLLALIAAAGRTLAVRQRRPALVLLGLSVLWLFANAWLEGPVLWSLDRDHGLVLADLLTPVGVLLALWRLWTLRTHPAGPVSNRSADPAISVRSDRSG